MRKYLAMLALLGLTISIIGCGGGSGSTNAQSDSGKPADALPADLIASKEPTGGSDIIALKKSAKDGESVVLLARVGGTEKPLAENRAMMTVADLSLPTCDKTAMNECKTPWDSCCEPKEVLLAKTATVQVVGADGKPLHATLSGVGGIAPLKHVIVSGIVRTSAGGDSLVVDAKQIYVVP